MSLEPAQLIWNLPTADTVNVFKSPKTKCMKDRLLEMEDACGKIMSLVKGKVDFVRHQWAFYEGTDRLDCAKSFLRHASLAYVEHKLRATGMINNARYLTDMLRLIASDTRGPHRLGADPNAMILGPHRKAPSIDMTIWQHLLLDFHRRLGDKEGKGRLIYPWLEADADVYASTLCRLCSKDGSYGDLSTAHRCPGNGFLIYEERVLCRLEWYHDIFDCLISQGDLNHLQRRPVLFLPRDGWFVLSDIDLSRLHILKDIQSLTEDQLYYDTFTIEVDYYELVIELHDSDCYSSKQQHEVFPNGYDAFRAAGWSDGDLQGLSIEPELLQRTYNTRVHETRHGARNLLG
ncbi:hypothetical protein LTS07_005612 [Exophiala sideris]|nr:hypothetical protein LTS07_005612 [Exophiala sideris]